MPGDAPGVGKVDASDLTLVAGALNTREGDLNFDSDADLNQDGIINIFDLVVVGRNFGRGDD